MKRVLAALVMLLGCSGNNVKIIPPELTFVQLSGPAEQNYPQGAFEVQYGIRIANRSSEPIVLRQIQLQSLSAGGPYRLRSETYFFRREIAPDHFEDVVFWAHAYSTGDASSIDSQAPVNIRGTAFFEAPSGAFRKVFMKVLNQMGGQLPR